MFSIDFLITRNIEYLLNKAENIVDKTEILLQLIEFPRYFSEYMQEISEKWYIHTNTRYNEEEYIIPDDDMNFIREYADKINNITKVKELINKLASLKDGVYDYDAIMAEAENDISLFTHIDDFNFTGSNTSKRNKKPSITSLLKSMPKHT